MRTALLLVAVALVLPSSAWAGAVQELRHGPVGGDCRIEAGPKEESRVKRWSPQLGGSRTQRAWRVLLRQGDVGCSAVAAWLVEGGPGLEPRRLADAARSLVEQGEPAHVEATLGLLDHAAVDVTVGVLEGLEKRLAVLDEATTWRLLEDQREGVPAAALALFAGHHSEGQVRFEGGVPVWEETAYWGATTRPPEHHWMAVAQLARGHDPQLRELAVKYLARHCREGHASCESWGRMLLVIALEGGEDAGVAAEGLGWGEPPSLEMLLGPLLVVADPSKIRRVLDGLEGRLEAGRGTPETLERIDRIAAAGEKGQFARAERLVKKWGRKLRPPAP